MLFFFTLPLESLMADNIWKAIDLIQHCKNNKIKSTLFLALDLEKAFDSIDISYLLSLIHHFNFGVDFRTAVEALNCNLKAQLHINSFSSSDFSVSWGICQGCPLFPLLFALALEPHAHDIKTNFNIMGVLIGNKEIKSSLFADEMVLFTLCSLPSIPYSSNSFSGLKVNCFYPALARSD